jgi:predicted DCC family thiol-disulfide oxidoreductase YuxK
MPEITVLTDGQCRFCEATMAWVAKKLDVHAIAYQSAEEIGYLDLSCGHQDRWAALATSGWQAIETLG